MLQVVLVVLCLLLAGISPPAGAALMAFFVGILFEKWQNRDRLSNNNPPRQQSQSLKAPNPDATKPLDPALKPSSVTQPLKQPILDDQVIFGFDSAWGRRRQGAICAITLSNGQRHFHPPVLVQWEAAKNYIEKFPAPYQLIALDQPTIVKNESGGRPVDIVADNVLRCIKSGALSANRTTDNNVFMFGKDAPVWQFFRDLEKTLQPFSEKQPFKAHSSQTGRYVIEVYPALALPALFPDFWQRGRAAKYDPGKNTFRLSDWKEVADHCATWAHREGLADVEQYLINLKDLPNPVKPDQDKLDSVICLLLGVCWRRYERTQMTVLGDGWSGYMVTARPQCNAMAEVLRDTSIRHGLWIDDPEGFD